MSKGFQYTGDPRDAEAINRWMDEVEQFRSNVKQDVRVTVNNQIADHESRLDALEYDPISLGGLSGGQTVEIGSTVTSVNLSWSISGANPVSQTLTDAGALGASARSHAFTGLTLTANKTYTLSVADAEGGTDSANAQIRFQSKRHWGISTNTALTTAQILALANNELATSRSQTRTFDCTGGRYIFFAWPSTWGTPTFTVNGLVDSSWVNATVSHTNASGHITDYHTWRSLNLLNGSSVTVAVS